VAGHELSGLLAVEGRLFFHDPLYDGQRNNSASAVFQSEYYHEWGDSHSFTFVPFGRYDTADPERSHFDIREFNWLWTADMFELRVGVGKVFWGVTEFVHLVDIINQTDLVESVDLEEKLGQPMVQLTVPSDWGVLSVFALPYFRERTFPGRKGRIRFELTVDTDDVLYESSAEENHVDVAARYSHYIGDWDFGLYYFRGTGREPWFYPVFDNMGIPQKLVTYYEQIEQTGLDVQFVLGQWLFKLESIYRWGQINRVYEEEDFYAATGGFEYTFVRVAETNMDLGIVGEWAYDERREDATTWYQNDVMAGFRLAVNDSASTEVLAWLTKDLDVSAKTVNVEASRRFGDNWKLNLELRVFIIPDKKDPLYALTGDFLYSLRDDDFLQLELVYYF